MKIGWLLVGLGAVLAAIWLIHASLVIYNTDWEYALVWELYSPRFLLQLLIPPIVAGVMTFFGIRRLKKRAS